LRYKYGEFYTHSHIYIYYVYVYICMYIYTGSTAMCARTSARCAEYPKGGHTSCVMTMESVTHTQTRILYIICICIHVHVCIYREHGHVRTHPRALCRIPKGGHISCVIPMEAFKHSHTHTYIYYVYVNICMYVYTGSPAMCARTRARCATYLW